MCDAGGRHRAGRLLHAEGALARATEHRRKTTDRTGRTATAGFGGRIVARLVVWWTTTQRYQPRLASAVDPRTKPSRHSPSRFNSQLEAATPCRAVSDHRHLARISHRAKSTDELRRKHDRIDKSGNQTPAR